MTIRARVVLDSVNPLGVRLTTVECVYPRFILAECNTHRSLSRNTASSRAIPLAKMREAIEADPAMPIRWGQNGKGMQDHGELDRDTTGTCKALVRWLMRAALGTNHALERLGLHKQVANRYIEPWMHARTLVSATEWENFFELRIHPAAQPEMRALAEAIRDAREASTPVPLLAGQWHLPFIREEEKRRGWAECVRASAARCARVSYNTHTAEKAWEDEMAMGDRLLSDGHLSPWEHVAQSMPNRRGYGNFVGWKQARKAFGED